MLLDNGERIEESEKEPENNFREFAFKINDNYKAPSAIELQWRNKQIKEHIRYLQKKFGRKLTKKELKQVKEGKL